VTSNPIRIHPENAPWMNAPETRAVVAALAAGGKPVRFVGGSVRDALVNRVVTDVDLATPEPPTRVMELLAAAGLKAVPTGIEHGTVTAVAGGKPFEITTLRRDVETDGRRAVVAFSEDWVEDASRRDFTINALSAEPDGTVHDPFGGVDDLKAGCVRFVGDAETRIREDVLRILRFFRFHAHFGRGAPEEKGLAACRALASLLPTLSAERIAAEILRVLKAPDAAGIIAVMHEAGVLAPILSELTDVARLRGLQALTVPEARDPILRLSALLPDDPAMAGRLAERLRPSNRDRDRLVAVAAVGAPYWPAEDMQGRRRALYRLGQGTVRDRALLDWARGDAARGRAAYDAACEWTPLTLPVRGQDVLDLGVAPGAEISRLLGDVERWWEAGDYRAGRAEALAELRRLVEKK
jgi:poly(A) polymerase